MFLTKLSLWLDDLFGTSVMLPTAAIQVCLPQKAFHGSGIDGYCIPRNLIGTILVKLYPNMCDDLILLASLKKLINKVDEAQENIHFVIIYSAKPNTKLKTTFLKKYAIHKSLINHERFHVITMMKPIEWHRAADSVLKNIFMENWETQRDALLINPAYSSMIKDGCEESWVITMEILARIAAILHAPKNARNEIAQYQLSNASQELICVANEVEKRWQSAEGLVGWLDALYWSK